MVITTVFSVSNYPKIIYGMPKIEMQVQKQFEFEIKFKFDFKQKRKRKENEKIKRHNPPGLPRAPVSIFSFPLLGPVHRPGPHRLGQIKRKKEKWAKPLLAAGPRPLLLLLAQATAFFSESRA